MNRRSFLSTFALLPGLGWLAPKTGVITNNYAEPTWPASQPFLRVDWGNPEPRYFIGDREVSESDYHQAFTEDAKPENS